MPHALARLKALIKKTKPKGLLFLSGDVHYSGIFGNEDNVVEVTSSGVNQANMFSPINKYLIYIFTALFNKRTAVDYNKIYAFNNFGSVNINYVDDDNIEIKTTVHNSNGEKMLVVNQVFNDKKDVYSDTEKLHVINDEFGTLMCKSPLLITVHFIIHLLILLLFFELLYITFKLFCFKGYKYGKSSKHIKTK
ncbi:hypothetical protein HEP_00386400 [Hepatocystis sp. ex Piliocolobus tephrosceles]|nr:hypothetical protein HEP_00386400 [Hepatocystis sp. ex Piliocolobus tephrosceles]